MVSASLLIQLPAQAGREARPVHQKSCALDLEENFRPGSAGSPIIDGSITASPPLQNFITIMGKMAESMVVGYFLSTKK
jgi:hypothetical protein